MKKKTMKQMIKKSRLNRKKIYAQVTFSDGRVLQIPVYADDQVAIDNLKQQLREKNGTFTDSNNNLFDLHNLVHYQFIE
ncbi:MAG: hypothetical protein J6584_03650 [Lactobacillus sp.]|jgi:Flp pilus assembly CpaF family ATPase|uniref:Uncharacterized protein n=1 Tax=Bombilactobacillus bombi TaxID=1303590 RepID=A0A347SQL5_9LACO|nr:hypothetical protein [Bombilactobacillus bombi]AXX64324.1 hypothetical protein DS830_02095 [Bombilactobacillus bombi]MCO6541667.1 hypothetical protein [Lactobacillus sp.]MCO6543049.1 hypothetical protein [Lactobacillus sp.]RHW48343.1 hypothetical protein DS832_01900 [Bombilactobacillus bombi]